VTSNYMLLARTPAAAVSGVLSRSIVPTMAKFASPYYPVQRAHSSTILRCSTWHTGFGIIRACLVLRPPQRPTPRHSPCWHRLRADSTIRYSSKGSTPPGDASGAATPHQQRHHLQDGAAAAAGADGHQQQDGSADHHSPTQHSSSHGAVHQLQHRAAEKATFQLLEKVRRLLPDC
jgi:hypothetical protein